MDRVIPEKYSEGLERDLLYVGISLLIVMLFVGVNNLRTTDEPMKVGYTEIGTTCNGVELANYCIGHETRNHTTYGYDNYTKPEPGTPNYYRRVESELMLQAYNICESPEVRGMNWTSEASYEGQTAEDWLENESANVQLLPCDETSYLTLEN